MLKRALTSDNLPHMLFYGPPGTGKTSTALALAKDLFGPQLYPSRLLELNASDERGIAVIRDKVKAFAKTTARETVPGFPCPPFKIILLDEADSLTADAQTALRRIMEVYSRGTRFCLVCNYVSRIIEPLTSRCAKFRFRPIDVTAGIARLREIAHWEGVAVGEETLSGLLQLCGGDLRRAITLLQSAHRIKKPITLSRLTDLAGSVPDALIQEAYTHCLSQDTHQTIQFIRHGIINGAYPAQQFLSQLVEHIIHDPTLPNSKKAMLMLMAAQKDYLLTDGASELLQLVDFLSYCQTILAANPPHIAAFQ